VQDQRDGGDAERGQLGEIVEDLARGHEQVGLRGQVGAAGLDQVDDREPALAGDLQRPQRLAQGVRVQRAAADGRVVGDQHALDAGDDAHRRDDAGPDGELGAPRGQGGQLQQRRVPVDQELDALAGQQPAALVVALRVPGAAARPGQLELLVQRADGGQLAGPVGPVRLAGGVHHRSQDGHCGS
jgi:hypothetical protein